MPITIFKWDIFSWKFDFIRHHNSRFYIRKTSTLSIRSKVFIALTATGSDPGSLASSSRSWISLSKDIKITVPLVQMLLMQTLIIENPTNMWERITFSTFVSTKMRVGEGSPWWKLTICPGKPRQCPPAKKIITRTVIDDNRWGDAYNFFMK